jgi:peptidoglycan/xylan/chitin deacetylase (PgdA/CDA1 family)
MSGMNLGGTLLSLILTIGLAIGLLAGLGVLVWYLVAAPLSQWLGPTIARGPREITAVALTFDDGPGPETPRVLDSLQSAGVRATFFLCGINVERYPEVARRIIADGHEIGNHTYSHLRLLGRSPGRIALEIDRAQSVIEHHTGRRPHLFRPPYGLRWFGLFPILARQKMRAVMWSVNSFDWCAPSKKITESVLRRASPGAIILLHDGVPPQESGNRQATAAALPDILRELTSRYRLVTISELDRGSELESAARG